MDEAIACGQASAPSQKPDRPRRPHGVLSRDEVLELGRKAREAIFPPHESEIGLMRGTPSVVHGVVSARATGARRPQWADEAGATASSAWTRESRRRKGIHCGGPRFSKPHLSKPRPNSSEGKPKKSLSIAVPPAEGMQGPTGEGCLSARGTAGEAAGGTRTPTSALSSAMNRALRLRGPDAGPASPIRKAGRCAAPRVPGASGAQVEGGRGDVYRYLGDAGAQKVGEGGGGVDRFLRDAYGLGDGKFVRSYGGPSGFAPDTARVLGRILGFPGDLIRPSSLLAHACFVCSREAGSLTGENVENGCAGEASSLAGPARALQGKGIKIKRLLDVWEHELAMMHRKACVDLQKMIQDLHFWPSWYDDFSEFDRKNMCGLLARCDLVFRTTFAALDVGESKHRAQAQEANVVGFVGKTPGLCGEPLTEGDMHKLMRIEELHAAVETLFSDLLQEALGALQTLAGPSAQTPFDAAATPAPFPLLRRGDWDALQQLGPAIEDVRQQVRDSRHRQKVLEERKANPMQGQQAGASVWERKKSKVCGLMKLGLFMRGGATDGTKPKSISPESLLACTLQASLSDAVKLARKRGQDPGDHASVLEREIFHKAALGAATRRSSGMVAALLPAVQSSSKESQAETAKREANCAPADSRCMPFVAEEGHTAWPLDLDEIAGMTPQGFLEAAVWGGRGATDSSTDMHAGKDPEQIDDDEVDIYGPKDGVVEEKPAGFRIRTGSEPSTPPSIRDRQQETFFPGASDAAASPASPRRHSAHPRNSQQLPLPPPQQRRANIRVFTAKGGVFTQEQYRPEAAGTWRALEMQSLGAPSSANHEGGKGMGSGLGVVASGQRDGLMKERSFSLPLSSLPIPAASAISGTRQKPESARTRAQGVEGEGATREIVGRWPLSARGANEALHVHGGSICKQNKAGRGEGREGVGVKRLTARDAERQMERDTG